MFDEVWDALEPAGQRDLLRLLLAEVVVHPDRVQLELHDGKRAMALLDPDAQKHETPDVVQRQGFVASMKWLQCWGLNDYQQVVGVPAGVFVSVAAGNRHACAMDAAGAATCWGASDGGAADYGQVTGTPGSVFSSLSSSDLHSCGLRTDDTLECWGRNDEAQATPPGGSFSEVSAGLLFHSCGLTTAGAVECWGDDASLQVSGGPVGSFSNVSAGRRHSCAVDLLGAIQCWGANDYGQSSPPPP